MSSTKHPAVSPGDLARFAAYYQCPDNGAWGSLHIVMDDPNYADHHVQFCIDSAHERGDTEGEYLARVLLTMSKTQRAKMPYKVYTFLKV